MAIDSYTREAAEDMSAGNSEFERAEKKKRGTSRCLCWIVIILLLVVAAVVLILYFTVFTKNEKK
jgi:flagellar basal body-associated protein FliL